MYNKLHFSSKVVCQKASHLRTPNSRRRYGSDEEHNAVLLSAACFYNLCAIFVDLPNKYNKQKNPCLIEMVKTFLAINSYHFSILVQGFFINSFLLLYSENLKSNTSSADKKPFISVYCLINDFFCLLSAFYYLNGRILIF